MDKTIPAGAAVLLDYIRKTEVGTADRSGYDVIYGHNQGKLPKPVTSMTIDEIQTAQRSWTRRFRSSATGGYQFMRATLKGLKDELGLSGSQRLDPDLQDRLGYHLLVRRGYHDFMGGRISRTEFGKRLAMEWASFPVLAMTRGSERTVHRGQSYYAGDGLNKALVAPETLEQIIDRAKAAAAEPPKEVAVPVPGVDKPLTKSTTFWSAVGGFITTALTAISSLHPAVAGLIVLVAAGFAFWIIKERRGKALAQRAILLARGGSSQ
ncbi:hypothetical protein [Hoeflea sp. TYP-13]|uniref:hypothetical protein n=1 Tax=Hoeflea sp. TYP-13 TaxID=3230023 RepID=UPI0034C617AA